MTPITIAPRTNSMRTLAGSNESAIRISGRNSRLGTSDNLRAGGAQRGRSEFLGGTEPRAIKQRAEATREDQIESDVATAKEAVAQTPKPASTETLEKVVRRIPTLYVIALFGVIVLCAVMMIWNTLRVNALTVEKTRNQDRIAQSEQRLIKLRAEEMQLSGPTRIRELAQTKFGMVDISGEDLVVVR